MTRVQVIVVQRPRRSGFAVLRALPDWLRSVRAALFRTAVSDQDDASAGSGWAGSVSAPLFPRLALDSRDAHRCVGCDLCVRVCPSRCLSLATKGEGLELQVVRFELAYGACIGCGFCVEACPEEAIEMAAGVRVEFASLSGRPVVADLLSDRSRVRLPIRSPLEG